MHVVKLRPQLRQPPTSGAPVRPARHNTGRVIQNQQLVIRTPGQTPKTGEVARDPARRAQCEVAHVEFIVSKWQHARRGVKVPRRG
jgi:hypothetical protein